MNTTISKTTIKTIIMKKSTLRVFVEATLFAGFVFDASVGACVICVTFTSVGAEVCMNDLGGACEGAGEKIRSCDEGFNCVCTIFCPGIEDIEIGETVDPCCGVLVELEVDSGNFGFADILVSSEVPGRALIFSCDGLVEFWVVNIDICGVVVAILFGALFASEKPHCGQNVACLRNSALHLGQRVGVIGATKGCGCCEGTGEDESRDD
jgi:hypothetical protein